MSVKLEHILFPGDDVRKLATSPSIQKHKTESSLAKNSNLLKHILTEIKMRENISENKGLEYINQTLSAQW